MRDFEDTWPSDHEHRTGQHRPDPRPFWAPFVVTLFVVIALAIIAVLL